MSEIKNLSKEIEAAILGNSTNIPTRSCLVCSKIFEPSQSNQVYCKYRCSRTAQSQKAKLKNISYARSSKFINAKLDWLASLDITDSEVKITDDADVAFLRGYLRSCHEMLDNLTEGQ